MALSRTQPYKLSGGPIEHFEIEEATKIYEGALVALNAAGYLIRATDTSGSIFVGIATETIDNTGADGDLSCKVDIGGGEVLVTHTAGSLTIANIGDYVYADGDDAVDNLANATNPMLVGKIVRVPSATTCWVHVRPFNAGVDDYTITATALTLTNMADGSADNTLVNITDTSASDQSGAIEQNFDKIGDEVNALIVDMTAVLRRLNAIGA